MLTKEVKIRTLALIILLACAACEINCKIEDLLSVAFENITSHLFRLETRMFINNYGVDSNTMTWLTLKRLNEKGMPFKLQNLEIDEKEILLGSSALLTFNSFKKLREFNKKLILTNEYYKPLQLFVYCKGITIEDLNVLASDVSMKPSSTVLFARSRKRIFRKDLEDIIQYEYFLFEKKKVVKVMTFVWYSEETCSELHLKEVNSFNKLTKKWNNDKFSIKKVVNFEKCKIKCNELSDLFYLKPFKGIMSMLEKPLLENTSKGTLLVANIKEGCYDSYERQTLLMYDPKKGFSVNQKPKIPNFITWPVHYEPQKLAVPVSDSYSEYEKLLMPFDFFTWALIASTFVASFTTILILYFVKRSIRDFVIGSNISTPSVNVIQIFFGISQIVVPQRNFARYLMMLFILFCLIIRTAWQGKMYEFMQKDVMRPEVQTVDEMIEKNFTFHMEYLFVEKFPESKIFRRGTIANRNHGFKMAKLLDYRQKVAFQTDLASELTISKFLKGRFTKRIRQEVIYIKMCGLVFPAHHYFVEMFDSLSQQLFTAGIIQHEYEDDLRAKIRAINLKYLTVEGPKVLDLVRLEPGFVIWLGSLTLTVIAFSLEWLNTLKDFIVFKYIFRAFFRMQHRFIT